MKKLPFLLLSTSSILLISACSEKPTEEAETHEHGHDCAHGPGCNHPSHRQDEQAGDFTKGPNKGKMLELEGMNVELLVTKEKHLQLNFFDSEMKMVKAQIDSAKATSGEAISPVELSFQQEGISMTSTSALPDGDNFPTTVTIQAGDKVLKDEFVLSTKSCEDNDTCDSHDHEECEGHDH